LPSSEPTDIVFIFRKPARIVLGDRVKFLTKEHQLNPTFKDNYRKLRKFSELGDFRDGALTP
tara:strand:- start:179 stop:364 length:186 start_codon:yes stop_codon:yes gene_type:complete